MRWVKVIFESESLKSHTFFTSGESPNAPPIINESCEKPAFSASFIITESSSEEICFPSTQRAIFLLFDGRTASIRSPSLFYCGIYLRLRRLIRKFFLTQFGADKPAIRRKTFFVFRSCCKKIIFSDVAYINKIYSCHFIISSEISAGAAADTVTPEFSPSADLTVSSASDGVLFSFER